MKTIGLIGGITWQSTIMYYEVLNRLAAHHYGHPSSAKVIIHSVDFGEISRLQGEGRWDILNEIIASAGMSLQNAGATQILICANTMHLCIDAVRTAVNIPVTHIAEATATQILDKQISRVALLGTKYTMEQDFFKNILQEQGIEVVIPSSDERQEIHRVIYYELSKGDLLPSSKASYINTINRLIADEGIEGVILGCTEIPLLINDDDVSIPTFDTTTIHANAAFAKAIL